MRQNIFVLSLLLASCGAFQSPDEEAQAPADEAVAIEDVVLSTGVELEGFTPSGWRGPVFQASTSQLYVSFLVRSGAAGAPLMVSWHQVGDDEPFSSSRLVVTGRHRMAAGYEAISAFEPGGYFVRIATDGQVLAEVGFEVEGDEGEPEAAIGGSGATVSRVRILRALAADGRPRGLPATVIPAGSTEVHCSFALSGAPRGTALAVRWIRGSELVKVDDLGQVVGDGDMFATLRPSSGHLQAGLYRAEVLVNGVVARSRSFTVEQDVSAQDLGPQVANLALTTAVDAETGRPRAPTITAIDGGVDGRIYLSVTFSRMPPESELEVRWLRDAEPEAPFATSTFEVQGRGSFAAALDVEPPMPPGRYRVDVVYLRRSVGSVHFIVEGEPIPPEPADGGVSE